LGGRAGCASLTYNGGPASAAAGVWQVGCGKAQLVFVVAVSIPLCYKKTDTWEH